MTKERDIFAEVFQQNAVPMTKSWPLVDDSRFVLTMMVIYVSLIVLGKRFMRDRPAFNLKPIMLVHNFSLVLLSAFMFIKFFTCSFLRMGLDPSFFCEVTDESIPCHHMLATAMWYWYMSKMVDLLDTAYHVLRKRPVSFLHAYHHTSVLFLAWVLVKYLPAGSVVLGPMINSFVHIIMYFYYGLATIGPHMQKYLWWKKYLTKLQIIQFIVNVSYTVSAYAYHQYTQCHFPPRMIGLLIFYCTSLFALFANFYYQSYIKKRSKVAMNGHDQKNGVNGASEHHNGDAHNGHAHNGDAHNGHAHNGDAHNGVDIAKANGFKSE